MKSLLDRNRPKDVVACHMEEFIAVVGGTLGSSISIPLADNRKYGPEIPAPRWNLNAMKSSLATFLSSSPFYPVLDVDSSRHWPSSPHLDSDLFNRSMAIIPLYCLSDIFYLAIFCQITRIWHSTSIQDNMSDESIKKKKQISLNKILDRL